jgi:glycerol-3-phosphate cytidylyltransferase-like family protein
VDGWVNGHRRTHHPIMHLHEHSLNVLACSYYVDEVIINAPWEVIGDIDWRHCAILHIFFLLSIFFVIECVVFH